MYRTVSYRLTETEGDNDSNSSGIVSAVVRIENVETMSVAKSNVTYNMSDWYHVH
jgi:hypothetical protein